MKYSLPKSKSPVWFRLLAWILLLNYSLFILSRIIVGGNLDGRALFSFLILSVIVTLVYLVGYLGARIWAYTFAFANIFALGYLMYSVIFNVADGWTDLASFIGMLFWLIAGFVLGAIFQLGIFIYRKISSKK